MKSQYRKVKHLYFDGNEVANFYYEHVKRSYYRRIRTMPEQRRREADDVDYGHVSYIDTGKNRGRNTKMLDQWNDFPKKRTSGNPRSWKDFTKHKKQWMTCFDPKPKPPRDYRRWGYMVAMGLEHDC